MKKILAILLITLSIGQTYGQTDKNNNPVFNSISTQEKSYGDLMLISNYYTLEHNIDNKLSSVFISEEPTLDQIEKASVNLPSDFFILTKDSKIIALINLQNDPEKVFITQEMRTGKQATFPSKLAGDITENRADEIIKEKYDPNAIIENGYLKFNEKEFKIISNQAIEEGVWTLIKKEKLDKKKPSDIMLPSKEEIKTYIIAETKEGGQLDFFTEIKGNESDGVQIKTGLFTTKESVALYRWGRACFEIGVNTVEDAYQIFEEFKGSSLSDKNQEYIKMGFYKEWER
ncbi:MAG TPA: hypothetical protein VK021_13015 [Flavobacteriaceae bacterium]|nr:hypothetical protein [Flavobacteriaceae bacterium]